MDFDNDGYADLVVGDEHGYINFFKRNSDGTLQVGEVLFLASGDTLDVGSNSAPCVYDYNNDGLLDLIIGKQYYNGGGVRLYLNQGTAANPEFSGYSPILIGNYPVYVRQIHPQMIDVNGDGLDDLIFGEQDGYTYYVENSGSAGAPYFQYMQKITVNGSPFRWPYPHRSSTLFVHDWDEDGVLDILQGNAGTFLYVFYGESVAVEESSSAVGVNSVALLSNPCRGQICFSVDANQPVNISVALWNISGRLVREWNVSAGQGFAEFNYSVPDLPAGIYNMAFTLGEEIVSSRVTVLN